MRDKIEYFLALSAIKITKILPSAFTFFILKSFAKALFHLLSPRKRLAYKNLKNAYPEKDDDEIYQIIEKNYESLAITLSEVFMVYNGKKELKDFLIEPQKAVEKVRELSNDGKRPILFTTAHFGNWEVLANYFATAGFPMVVIGREGDNLIIEKNITTPFRTRFGNDLAHKDNAMSQMVRFLKSGRNVGILIDQKAGNINSLETTFFGSPCKTSKTIGQLKLKFDPVIIPIFSLRREDGRYEIIIKPFDFTPSDDKEADVARITQELNDIFEEVVRMAPQQWFWMHNRWKMD